MCTKQLTFRTVSDNYEWRKPDCHRPREGGLRQGENFWLHVTTASAQCFCLSECFFLFLNVFVYDVVSSQRGSDSNHSYSARFVDGKLVYEGTVYELGQHILIETRNSPAVQYVFVVHFLLNNTLQYNCL